MKSAPSLILIFIAVCVPARSQDGLATVSTDSNSFSSARILGAIPDGTPPPAEAPKPQYKVAKADILKVATHEQGGRTISIRQIKPIALPPSPPQAVESVAASSPEFLQRLSEFRAAHPRAATLSLGATIYHSKNHPVRTLLQLWPEGGGAPVKIWSSADFSLIAGGISRFVDTSRRARHLMIMPSRIDIDRMRALHASKGKAYSIPRIPTFPEGDATFQIIGEQASPSDLTALQSLHDLYNLQHAELLSAYQGREQARLLRETELKANPPTPKDITLNYWRTEKPAAKGKGETNP